MAKDEPSKTEEPLPYLGAKFIIHEVECICQNKYGAHLANSSPSSTFQVFQIVEPDGSAIPGIFSCDNCGRKWRVEDIDSDHELMDMDAPASYDLDGLKKRLHPVIVNALEQVHAPVSRYAWSYWAVTTQSWGASMAIGTREGEVDTVRYRLLTISSASKVEISDLTAPTVANVVMPKPKKKRQSKKKR